MQYIKFGFGRCTRDAARMIQQGHLSVEKAKEYNEKYDGELRKKFKSLSDYLNIDYNEFLKLLIIIEMMKYG